MIAAACWTIAVVQLLGCMSPGPDFIMVVKNALSYNRRIGVFTVLGVTTGILMHASYCALGLGLVLLKMPWLFQVLRGVGAVYLAYLSIKIFCAKTLTPTVSAHQNQRTLSAMQAFRQGFFTNALNPKAVLFILGLFIMVTKFDNPWLSVFFVFEMSLVTLLWFLLIVYCFSHARLKVRLLAVQDKVSKCLAVFLALFALELALGWG